MDKAEALSKKVVELLLTDETLAFSKILSVLELLPKMVG